MHTRRAVKSKVTHCLIWRQSVHCHGGHCIGLSLAAYSVLVLNVTIYLRLGIYCLGLIAALISI